MAGTKIRDDKSPAELRVLASREDDGKVVRRLLGIALALEGTRRQEAARLAGLDKQCLVDTINRYNAEGVDGLKDKPHTGRPHTLSKEQQAELRELVLAGPGERDIGVTEYRVRHIMDLIKEKWSVNLSNEAVRDLLHSLGLRNLVCRPVHQKADPVKQAEYKANFPSVISKVAADHPEAKAIEVWSQDETRIGQKSAVGRRWAERGSSLRRWCKAVSNPPGCMVHFAPSATSVWRL